jgi:hypothetical protein
MWNIWPERKVDKVTIADAFQAALQACVAIAPIFAHDGNEYIVLEFENVYVNYLLLGKKLYATLQYSADLGPEKPKKTVKKGLRCVRRDGTALARESQSLCVDFITTNRPDEALAEGRRVVRALFNGDVPFTQLTTSKKVSSSYVATAETITGQKVKVKVTPHGCWETREGAARSGTCEVVPGKPWKMLDAAGCVFGTLTLAQPHVHVLHRMESRTPGSGPRVGDRVRYVFVDNQGAGSELQIARAEDPVWAQQNGMKADFCYYFEHSVKPPLEAVLSLFAKNGGCDADLGWALELLSAKNKGERQNALTVFGFGVANPVQKTSKVARRPSKKAKVSHTPLVKPKGGKGGIQSFFNKLD